MLKKIRIRNFKSIEDITLELDEVNLLIGTNNSGKSNILKALEFFSHCYYGKDTFIDRYDDFDNRNIKNKVKEIDLIFDNEEKYLHCYYKLIEQKSNIPIKYKFISFITKDNDFIGWEFLNDFHLIQEMVSNDNLCILNFSDEPFINYKSIGNQHGIANETPYIGLTIQPSPLPDHKFRRSREVYPYPALLDVTFLGQLHEFMKEIKVYKPDINKLKEPASTEKRDIQVISDTSNLVSFLDNMNDEKPEIKIYIEKDIKRFVKDYEGIRFKKVELKDDNRTHKKIGLIDERDKIFWAEELSDGVLYFLSLLCIVHQPNPPKLLLLEEPESFMHPRRITEVIDLLIELANDKGIQVIMTTHSPLVVDEFSDIPEAVHVVEMDNGITKVKNLKKDIIDVTNDKIKKKGWEPIDYSKSLGENWIIGLLGGMPND